MKSFGNWVEDLDNDAMKTSNMGLVDDRKINKILDIARRCAEKHTDKLIEVLWRIAHDRDDDELVRMLEKVDPAHMSRSSKRGFGMGDDDKRKQIDDFVPSSADSGGSGDAGGGDV